MRRMRQSAAKLQLLESDAGTNDQDLTGDTIKGPAENSDLFKPFVSLKRQYSRAQVSDMARWDSSLSTASALSTSFNPLLPCQSPVTQTLSTHDYCVGRSQQYQSPSSCSSPVALSRSDAVTVSALALAEMLKLMVIEHQRKWGKTKQQTINFDTRENLQEETLANFIERVGDRLRCSYPCYLIGALYVQRLLARNPCLFVSIQHINCLYGIGVVIAAKFMDDTYYTNKFYSSVCQFQLKTFNDLERVFSSLVGFEFCVRMAEFDMIREHHCQRQFEIVNRSNTVLVPQPVLTTAVTPQRQQQQQLVKPFTQQQHQKHWVYLPSHLLLQTHPFPLRRVQLLQP